jgi:hypothetical protein
MSDKVDYQLALTRACIAYAEFTGSCPLDMHDQVIDCEQCEDNSAKCWQKYFLGEGE